MPEVTRLDWIARLGFFARAVVYMLLGYIALTTASKADEGQRAVFDHLRELPGGTAWLLLIGVGLLAYGLFRLATAFLDLDHEGDGWKGIAKRAGKLFSGIAHILLGYTAFQFISRVKDATSGGGKSEEAARTLLDLPLGSLLLGMVGVYFLITAAAQAMKAYKATFMEEVQAGAPDFTRTVGRLGHAARALVFAVIGFSFIKAAWFDEENRTREIGGALADLQDQGALYTMVAIGLILFGVFSLILARYAIVPKIDMAEAARSGSAGLQGGAAQR
jgi:hypothetical protein